MSKLTKFDKLLDEFAAIKNSRNVSCKKFCNLLRSFGFEILDCRRGGHKLVRHPQIPLLESMIFNCGHNLGDEVKPAYMKILYKHIINHKDAIKKLLD